MLPFSATLLLDNSECKLCKIEIVNSLCLGIFSGKWNVKKVFILQFELFLGKENHTCQMGE